ncbi:type II RES/Xre toxin-antitoxin system antitoxin [Salaquimonas pukyongi]|uniref:type II RES/Xre toxin-antitoxin system antitoxin n=1 Tax=Salaquimonas pukyongi TaxID=2712698 RepID=UPI0009F93C11|nr:antitoxin Xre/MbcA/ParS toxin-binding domain-containing protein [Salaquimonas pukyongi]
MSNNIQAAAPAVDEKARAGTNPSVSAFKVPASRLEKLKSLGFSAGEIAEVVAPRRTLDRRKKSPKPLPLDESDRVLRLERIMEHAERVLGTREKANLWLRRPNRALNGAIPMELLKSESGAFHVSEVLGHIEFGMYS